MLFITNVILSFLKMHWRQCGITPRFQKLDVYIVGKYTMCVNWPLYALPVANYVYSSKWTSETATYFGDNWHQTIRNELGRSPLIQGQLAIKFWWYQ